MLMSRELLCSFVGIGYLIGDWKARIGINRIIGYHKLDMMIRLAS